ncbi:hypothetical protein C8Q80DRAFT_1348255 [Daedaleopsis nitida]|nr:hypothetical protein C8Q80DRAFT_1348255 [Daedaleopsis nitida]
MATPHSQSPNQPGMSPALLSHMRGSAAGRARRMVGFVGNPSPLRESHTVEPRAPTPPPVKKKPTFDDAVQRSERDAQQRRQDTRPVSPALLEFRRHVQGLKELVERGNEMVKDVEEATKIIKEAAEQRYRLAQILAPLDTGTYSSNMKAGQRVETALREDMYLGSHNPSPQRRTGHNIASAPKTPSPLKRSFSEQSECHDRHPYVYDDAPAIDISTRNGDTREVSLLHMLNGEEGDEDTTDSLGWSLPEQETQSPRPERLRFGPLEELQESCRRLSEVIRIATEESQREYFALMNNLRRSTAHAPTQAMQEHAGTRKQRLDSLEE